MALIQSLPPDTNPDPEYRVSGVWAHAAWAWCLRESREAWEALEFQTPEAPDYTPTAEDIDAGQFYLALIRKDMWTHSGVEEKIHAPEIHDLAFGTLDYWQMSVGFAEITDYKHGEGMFVAAEGNWQLMGYAALLLSKYPAIRQFKLRIVQPRFEGQAKVRECEITAEELRQWVRAELQPAMRRAWAVVQGNAPTYEPGDWCRFCPAKEALACPAHHHSLAVVEQTAPLVERLSDERLGALYQKIEPLKMMIKAIEAETSRRALAGIKIPGVKVVNKKAFRVWKATAEKVLRAQYGPEAFKVELQSPAVVEKMTGGKAVVREYAFTPDNGLTTAPLSDPRKAVEVQKPSETFKFALTNNAK